MNFAEMKAEHKDNASLRFEESDRSSNKTETVEGGATPPTCTNSQETSSERKELLTKKSPDIQINTIFGLTIKEIREVIDFYQTHKYCEKLEVRK